MCKCWRNKVYQRVELHFSFLILRQNMILLHTMKPISPLALFVIIVCDYVSSIWIMGGNFMGSISAGLYPIALHSSV